MIEQEKFDLKIFVYVWIIFSVSYIAYDLWSDFKLRHLNQAYLNGKTDTINQLIKQVGDLNCQPISIYNEEKSIKLVSAECFKQ